MDARPNPHNPPAVFLVVSYALYWGMGCYLVLAHQVKFGGRCRYSIIIQRFHLRSLWHHLFIGQLSGFLSDWLGREKTGTLAAILSIIALLALLSSAILPALAFCTPSHLFWIPEAALRQHVPGPRTSSRRHFWPVVGLLLTGWEPVGAIGPVGGYLFDISGPTSAALSLASFRLP